MDDPPTPEPPAPLSEPPPDPALLRAQAIRQGIARALCGLGLSLLFLVAATYALDGDRPVQVRLGGFGACLGLGLFAQALVEHALRERGRLLRWAVCWGFSSGVVLLAFAQAFAFPALWAGNPSEGLREAYYVVGRLLIGDPQEGFAILVSLGSPLALQSLWTLGGSPRAGVLTTTLAPTVCALPLHLAVRFEAKELHVLLLVAAVALPALRWAGDRLEAAWLRWRGFAD